MGRYHRDTIRLDDPTSSWAHVVAQVGQGAPVLDLGCFDGLLLEALKARTGAEGVGVERDPRARAAARARGLEVLDADLDAPEWVGGLAGRRFPFVVAADVLEHLRDPVAVLRSLRDGVLSPGGRVVISVPNVTHGSVRLGLLLGAFEPADEGILDRTHLHFPTLATLHRWLADASLVVVHATRVERPLAPEVVERSLSRAGLASPALVRHLVEDPDARTFQWVVVAMRTEEAAPPAVASFPPNPPPRARDPLGMSDRAIARHVRKIERLQARLDVLEGRGPLRWLRYLRLRWRQRGGR